MNIMQKISPPQKIVLSLLHIRDSSIEQSARVALCFIAILALVRITSGACSNGTSL